MVTVSFWVLEYQPVGENGGGCVGSLVTFDHAERSPHTLDWGWGTVALQLGVVGD